MKKLARSIIGAVIIGMAVVSFAQPLEVDEIINRANNVAFYSGENGRANVHMKIIDSQGREREREFTILRLDVQDGGAQKYYVYFKKPSDVKDMVYMVWKYLDRDDDRWMYLPALDLVRRISASDKRSSFVGSHFVYEDISGRNLELDTHELTMSDGDFYVVRNTPKDAAEVEFAYYDVFIRKDNFLPVKAEYYNSQDKKYRVIEALEIQEIEGIPTVIKSIARDLDSGGSTITTFSGIEYNIGLDDSIFTERYLRRPPRKWLQ